MRTVVVFEEAQEVLHTRGMRPCVCDRNTSINTLLSSLLGRLLVGILLRKFYTTMCGLQLPAVRGSGKIFAGSCRHQHGDACGRHLPSWRALGLPCRHSSLYTGRNPRICLGSSVIVLVVLLEGVVWYAGIQRHRSVVEFRGIGAWRRLLEIIALAFVSPFGFDCPVCPSVISQFCQVVFILI